MWPGADKLRGGLNRTRVQRAVATNAHHVVCCVSSGFYGGGCSLSRAVSLQVTVGATEGLYASLKALAGPGDEVRWTRALRV